MRNTQSRVIAASPQVVGALLDQFGEEKSIWPSPRWPALRLSNGLTPGSAGGHGPIRYHVSEYEPGRRVRFVADPPTPFRGYHELRVEPHERGSRLVHEIVATPRWIPWLVAIRWLHEALLADLLDNAERATGTPRPPRRHSVWVRTLRRAGAKRPQSTDVAPSLGTGDLADAWMIRTAPGIPQDPQTWADAVFRDPPPWVGALLVLRNRLVRLIGVRPADRKVFDTIRVDGQALLLGADDEHLDFRCLIEVAPNSVTVSTVAQTKNWPGRFYLAIVKLVHPVVVRSMLARAARSLTSTPHGAIWRAP